MRPRLSFCIPAHRGGEALLGSSLASLRWQTAAPASFEVVVGADGLDPEALAASIRADRFPMRVRCVASPRTCDLAHRNHARNAALQAAHGDLVWVVDSDFLWAPNAVAHALA